MATFVFYTQLIAHQRDSQSENKKHFLLFLSLFIPLYKFYLPIFLLSQELALTLFVMQVYW